MSDLKTLVIVESPAKCKKITEYLGAGYIVKASFGHIRDITDGLKGVDTQKGYAIQYGIMDSKSKVISELRKVRRECRDVILASDPDREGEAISFHLAIVLGIPLTQAKRMRFQEITKQALRNAVANTTTIDMNLVRSQEARRVLDLLVGYELSPLVSRHLNTHGLSAGRCQSPAVRLVLDRENDIEAQETVSSFHVTVTLTSGDDATHEVQGAFVNKYSDKDAIHRLYDVIKNNAYFTVRGNGTVMKLVEHAPPKPYTTSTIQQDCSSSLSMSPKETMSILQKLYEEGKITYMRTDSVAISKEATTSITEDIAKRFGSEYVCSRTYTNKDANAQEAHEAIRPTHTEERTLVMEGATAREARVYDMVWKRTMASMMSSQKIQRYTTNFDMYSGGRKYEDDYVVSTYEKEIFNGWRILYSGGDEGAEKDTHDGKDTEHTVSPDKHYTLTLAEAKQNYVRTIGRYTEASLIGDLESRGIGRPSTYATIMETIRVRGYVEMKDFEGTTYETETYILTKKHDSSYKLSTKRGKTTLGKEKKKITITALGKNVMAFLTTEFANVVNYDFTQQVENELDDICVGRKSYTDVVARVHQSFHGRVEELKSVVVRSASSNAVELGFYDLGDGKELPVILKNGKYGFYLQFNGKNYGCERIANETRKHKITVEHDIEEAVAHIEEVDSSTLKDNNSSELDSTTFVVAEFRIIQGKYGFYFRHEGKNHSCRGYDPSKMTREDCMNIMKGKSAQKTPRTHK